MKLSKHTFTIGVLLAALAVACAPKSRKAAAEAQATGEADKKKDEGKVTLPGSALEDAEALAGETGNGLVRKMLSDPALLKMKASVEKENEVDCMYPRLNQIYWRTVEGALHPFTLSLTCASRIVAGNEKSNNVIYRVSIGGMLDTEKKSHSFDDVSTMTMVSEEMKLEAAKTEEVVSDSTQEK
jgi:hypothetical protein